MKKMLNIRVWMTALMFALTSIVAAPLASAGDPQIDAAKARGVVGERLDGYIGFVKLDSSEPSLKRKVDEINAKRRALYQKRAAESGVTPTQYATATGEKLIKRAAPSAMVVDVSGAWVRAKDAVLPE